MALVVVFILVVIAFGSLGEMGNDGGMPAAVCLIVFAAIAIFLFQSFSVAAKEIKEEKETGVKLYKWNETDLNKRMEVTAERNRIMKKYTDKGESIHSKACLQELGEWNQLHMR